MAVGSAACVVAGLPLAAVNWRAAGPESVYVVNAIIGALVPFAGAFLLERRPGHRIGRVLLSAGGLGVLVPGPVVERLRHGVAARRAARPGVGGVAG